MFDIKETQLYDKWVSEALNIGIEMNGEKRLKSDHQICKQKLKLLNLTNYWIAISPLIVGIRLSLIWSNN